MRRIRTAMLLILDAILINLGYLLAIEFVFYSRFNEILAYYKDDYIIVTLIYLVMFYLFKLYNSLWDLTGIDEFLLGISGSLLAGALSVAYTRIFGSTIPLNVCVIATVLITLFVMGIRIFYRVLRRIQIYMPNQPSPDQSRVLVIGAGSAGNMIVNEMLARREFKMVPIALIDDDKNKKGKKISGVKVVGTRNDIKTVVVEKSIDTILIAIPTLDNKNKNELISLCQQTDCELRIIPGIYEIINGEANISNSKKVELEDLLGRESIKLDNNEISSLVSNKVVLVSGGGGSIGSELCRQICKYNPKTLIIFDIYENSAYDIQNELLYKNLGLNIITLIGSVRDENRLREIFEDYKVDIVFHAAAHKHVPLMEDSPKEAIKNNVFGTYNLAKVANEMEIEKFVLISTDKAVNPTNVMGATKRLCEIIIQAFDKASKTDFVAVRFGNVLGSNGSVIPLFEKQIKKGGPVTVTHKDINRFFMLIPEAAQLVLQAASFAKGGEIFILDMGEPVKIYDLACELIRLSGFEPGRDIKIEFTGLRPGEKLYEELLMSEEGLTETKHNKIYVGRPIVDDIAELQLKLDGLKELLEEEDVEKLKDKLTEIVPTYKRNI